MDTSTDNAVKPSQRYTYVSLLVVDGQRKLKPAAVSFDRLEFRTPPQLKSTEVKIVVTNGDWQDRHLAEVLPHQPEATTISVRHLKML